MWGENQDYVGGALVAAIQDLDRTYIVNPVDPDQIFTPNFQLPQTKQTLRVFAEGYFVISNSPTNTLVNVEFIGRPFDDFTLGRPNSAVMGAQGNMLIRVFDAPVELNPQEPLSVSVTGTAVSDAIVGLIVSVATPIGRVIQGGVTILNDAGVEGIGMIAWGFPGSPFWTAAPSPGLADMQGRVPPEVDQGSLVLVAPNATTAFVWEPFLISNVPSFTLNNNAQGITVPPNRRCAFKLEGPPTSDIVFASLNVAPNQGVTFAPWTLLDRGRDGGTQVGGGLINYSGWYGVFDTQNLPTIKVLSNIATTPQITARILLL